MDYEVVAEGVGTDVAGLEAAESQLKEGTETELRLYVQSAPSPEGLRALESELLAQGIQLTGSIVYDSGVVVVRFIKTTLPAPPATSIGWIQFALIGVAALGVIVFAWQMASKVGSAMNNPLLIFAAVALVILWFVMRPQKTQEAQA